ncbi:T9SS type A sorting domain-containing protein [Flavobacterium sp.]|uniref:T9SS type A sorting domain-containing protein n=1 Tax=Flavobacterium sp. TaxID=239 RepID=UPI002627BD38|nr:T9SS type A sorting domain-containing protein [Flavobacterium sp.]
MKLLYLLIFVSQVVFSQTVTLDPTFGTNGKVINSFYAGIDQSGVVIIQDDMKILVCGAKDFSVAGNIYIARYNTDGSLDTGFGTGGVVFTPLMTESGGNRIIKLLADGKILVTSARSVSNNTNFFDFATMRYNADGSVDTTFGTNGMVQTDINGSGNYANAIDVQSDGKIIVAGSTYLNSNTNVGTTLVRYSVDGQIDTTFGTDGKVILNLLAPNTSQFLWDIKILADDSILLGVTTTAFETLETLRNIAILKISSNGAPDLTFGTNGAVVTDFGAKDILYAIDEFQGAIYMAGYSQYPNNTMILSKYLPNGTLDTTFGIDGKVKTNKDATSLYDGLYSMKVQSNGKILCSGWTTHGQQQDALLIQFNADGSIDTGFNGTGFITTDFGNLDNINFSFAVQPDGKIVCAGWVGAGSDYDSTLIRYDVTALTTNQFNAKSEFSVFPNPFANNINIRVDLAEPQNLAVDLLDGNGRKIQNLLQDKPFSLGENVVELSMPESLSRGVYFIRISNDSSVVTLKLIK